MAPISVTLAPREPPAAVVALVGEHDAYSSGRLEAEISMLLDGGRHVVVDLRDATFIDSTTLSALLSSRRRAEEASLGFALVLPNGTSQVHQILDLTGLRTAFATFDGLDEALAAVRRGRVNAQATRAALT